MPRTSARLVSAVALAAAFAALGASGTQRPARASAAPRIVFAHRVLANATKKCVLDVQSATATGVPAGVAARIDGVLREALIANMPEAFFGRAAWNAACAKDASGIPSSTTGPGGYQSLAQADWTPGLERGRWLSVRLHVTYGSNAQAHPSDAYVSMTFDLDHGGYPVPASGFYRASARARLNARVADAAIVAFPPQAGFSAADMRSMVAEAKLGDADILLKPAGIEVTNFLGDGAGRNATVVVPYAKLAGIGTPGGPLDPSTR